MRLNLNYLCGVALLSAAAYLIEVRSTPDLAEISKSKISPVTRNLADRSADSSKPALRVAAHQTRSSGTEHSGKPLEESPLLPSRTIQLGSNVRLPAALMHQASVTATTPEITAASQGIIDSFYQEISIQAPRAQLNPPDAEIKDTRTIPASPETDGARRRADDTYRALYGNETFNRHSINSALEVHLPELSE
jgi:hypothetical protein